MQLAQYPYLYTYPLHMNSTRICYNIPIYHNNCCCCEPIKCISVISDLIFSGYFEVKSIIIIIRNILIQIAWLNVCYRRNGSVDCRLHIYIEGPEPIVHSDWCPILYKPHNSHSWWLCNIIPRARVRSQIHNKSRKVQTERQTGKPMPFQFPFSTQK